MWPSEKLMSLQGSGVVRGEGVYLSVVPHLCLSAERQPRRVWLDEYIAVQIHPDKTLYTKPVYKSQT